jgi:hypothetical protein
MERLPEILLAEDDDEDAELALAALSISGFDKSVRATARRSSSSSAPRAAMPRAKAARRRR